MLKKNSTISAILVRLYSFVTAFINKISHLNSRKLWGCHSSCLQAVRALLTWTGSFILPGLPASWTLMSKCQNAKMSIWRHHDVKMLICFSHQALLLAAIATLSVAHKGDWAVPLLSILSWWSGYNSLKCNSKLISGGVLQ